jgi:sugar O-acyltransferase (sialic acid O-acetyltransferase NeuD family)
MRQKLIIVGAGGAGREVARIARDVEASDTADWQLVGFLDDDPNALCGTACELSVLGSIGDWNPSSDEVYVCSVGSPDLRHRLTATLEERGARFVNLVHPSALVWTTVPHGLGIVVYPFSFISANVTIGRHVMINAHCSVGHDASIGDYSVLSGFCDVTGRVRLGSHVFLGSHATIAPGQEIGDHASVGIGSVVVAPVRAGKKVFGNPARSLVI